jgi:hypothetical protein
MDEPIDAGQRPYVVQPSTATSTPTVGATSVATFLLIQSEELSIAAGARMPYFNFARE